MEELAVPQGSQDPESMWRACPWSKKAIKVVKQDKPIPAFVFQQKEADVQRSELAKALLAFQEMWSAESHPVLHSTMCIIEKRHSYSHSLCVVALHCLAVPMFLYVILCRSIAFPKYFLTASCTFRESFVL